MPIPDGYNVITGGASGPGDNFELLEEDTYEVKITKLDLKTDQPVYQKPGELEDKLVFEFTVVEEGKYKGRKLWLDARPIMTAGFAGGNASWLYKVFCAANKVSLQDEDVKTVTTQNVNELVGKTLRLVVKQKLNTKGVLKNKIENVLATKQVVVAQQEEAPVPDEEIGPDEIPF